ncbi:hypothetical protein BD324DRAFT_624812 [Kockovaella imperatae]|uniref:Uncharacterized protein n=1 Tax=Kockovaella imperatae TaxID=4999 RepID=A0A1Y1UHZ6_9TREE|nr:hypothetical protein BD324DRAFT_624812 [Kockovaella imperatae]ORX37104.1 hypothetical protein BD324DRAFT_624812 [Kockovaella imperatae]
MMSRKSPDSQQSIHHLSQTNQRDGSPGSSSSPKKRKIVEDVSSQSTISSPAKKKPAPAEKVGLEHRALIIKAMVDPKFLKNVKMPTVDGAAGSKLLRHWREVLSKELAKVFSGQEVKSGAGAAKGSVSKAQRFEIWRIVCEASDKVDWASVEEESGINATKLKRHFKEVMKKDGDKYIGK